MRLIREKCKGIYIVGQKKKLEHSCSHSCHTVRLSASLHVGYALVEPSVSLTLLVGPSPLAFWKQENTFSQPPEPFRFLKGRSCPQPRATLQSPFYNPSLFLAPPHPD